MTVSSVTPIISFESVMIVLTSSSIFKPIKAYFIGNETPSVEAGSESIATIS